MPSFPTTPRISVVIPARNEARNLAHVLPYIPAEVDEVILVDGRSSDDTIAAAQRLLPAITTLTQPGRGKGDALRAGFAASSGDILVTLDADGSANPSEIPRFVGTLLDGADFAKGSRFLSGGGSADITRLRQAGNHGLNLLVNGLFATRFTDLCYGFNAFWSRCLEYFDVDCTGFEVETLINLRAQKAGLKIVEVPSYERLRIYGKSNLHTFRDGWRVLRTILQERASGESVVRLRQQEDAASASSAGDSSDRRVSAFSEGVRVLQAIKDGK